MSSPTSRPKKPVGKTKVLNKAPAPTQITAEQIIRESFERPQEDAYKPPIQKITDPEELKDYQLSKRKAFEDKIRRNQHQIGVWLKYAEWEAKQEAWERARSVYERVLDVGQQYRNKTIWLKYAEFEMKNEFVNHARNVWDRAVQLLPRVDQLWYKYAWMEEMLGNIDGARAIFERWMKWHPPANAWESYIKLEGRCGGSREDKLNRARKIYERFTHSHEELETYLKWANFEVKHGDMSRARQVYEKALNELGDDAHDAKFFTAFANLEIRAKETERARAIYKFALDHVPKHEADELFRRYTAFEKTHGNRDNIDTVILSKRRFEYEEELKKNERNYDVWFDYVKLEESNGNQDRIRELYERSIGALPPDELQEKRLWRRYIYLWIRYALYEELKAEDIERTRTVYKNCLRVIPHKQFTFGKIWIMFAEFEIRQGNLEMARTILGQAIGMCPKANIFRRYIDVEFLLGNFDRCRKLYEKELEWAPDSANTWTKYADLECSLGEESRARAIYELSINQEVLDIPEKVWKQYIDFEVKVRKVQNARTLYNRLLDRTKHVKVWINFAQFEAQNGSTERARAVYQRADEHFKADGEAGKEDRKLTLDKWFEFEESSGTAETQKTVRDKFPERVKRKRLLKDEAGNNAGWEEFYDYIYPDGEGDQSAFNLMQTAKLWKEKQAAADDEDEESSSSGESGSDDEDGSGDSDDMSDEEGDEDEMSDEE